MVVWWCISLLRWSVVALSLGSSHHHQCLRGDTICRPEVSIKRPIWIRDSIGASYTGLRAESTEEQEERRPPQPQDEVHLGSEDAGLSNVEEYGRHRRDPMWQERSTKWVLLVDDEESIRTAVGQLLCDKGFQVTACDNGATALKIAKSRQRPIDPTSPDAMLDGQSMVQVPDIIVSDIRMPVMDGLELLKRIRADQELVQVPVVLLTAKGMTQDRIAGYQGGADAYIPKPFDPDELVAIMDGLLSRRDTLTGTSVDVEEIQRDLDEIKRLLLEQGGAGLGNGWVEQTNVFFAPDERQVLELLCQGMTNKEIAKETFLSTRRVEQLLTNMFQKAQVKNRTELVRWAISTGNVDI